MSAASGEEENHWPGYVDALTTMTMMLIFIMTILAVTIFGLSQNISRSFVERIARAANIDVEAYSATGTQEFAERVVSTIERQPSGGGAVAASAGAAPAAREGRSLRSAALAPVDEASKVAVERAPALLTLAFNPRATRLDDATAGEMQDFLAKGGHLAGAGVIQIKAYAARAGAVSDARRVAFYRLMTVRQRLVAMGVPAGRIKAVIEDRDRVEDGQTLQILAEQAA